MENKWNKQNVLRGLRLVMGIVLGLQGLYFKDWLPGTLGLVLIFQAIFNTGCCMTGNCHHQKEVRTEKPDNEIHFEEIR